MFYCGTCKVLTTFPFLQFDQKLRSVEGDNLAKATLLRMQKDFEKLRINVESLGKEALLVRVEVAGAGAGSKPAGFGPSIGGPGKFGDDDRHGGSADSNRPQQSQMLQQETVFRPVLQEHDIDQMLIEERERDIKKINEDLAIVHDMFV